MTGLTIPSPATPPASLLFVPLSRRRSTLAYTPLPASRQQRNAKSWPTWATPNLPPPTPLFCDNEVAIGIAADTVSQRKLMSKVQGHGHAPALDPGPGPPGTLPCPFYPRPPQRGGLLYKAQNLCLLPVIASALAPFIAADPTETIVIFTISSIFFAASY